jgi:iron complex outermembrane receptor protein
MTLSLRFFGCTMIGGLALSGVAAAAAPAGMQAAQADTSPAISEVVVTAQRRSENLKDVPLTVSVLSGAALVKQGVTSSRDLTAAFPGLTFTTQGAFAEPTIRGVSATISGPGQDANVAIYLDGIYQPGQVSNIFDLPDIDSIEVLKGPQGTLFGRNATGGAILVNTKKPSFTPTGSFTLNEGAYFGGSAKTANHFSAQGYVSGPIMADTLAASLSGAYDNTPGYMTNDVTGGRYGKITSYQIRGKLLFKPTDEFHVLLSAAYANRHDDANSTLFPADGINIAHFYPGSVIPTQPWHSAGELGGGSRIRLSRQDISLEIGYDFKGLGTLTSRTGYSHIKPEADVDVDATYSPNCLAAFACFTPYVVANAAKTYQEELIFNSEKFGPVRFTAGAFYYHDRQAGYDNLDAPFTPGGQIQSHTPGIFTFDSFVTTVAYAGFGEVNYDILENLTATAGLRYSHERHTGEGRFGLTGPYTSFPPAGPQTNTAFTPRISLRYAVNDAVNVYGTYSQGFKSGVLNSASLTLPAVDPEHLNSWEAGVKVKTRSASFNLSGFYYIYKDLQVEFFNNQGTTLVSNLPKARTYGFDVDGTIQLTNEFRLSAAATWIPYAKYTENFLGADFDYPLTPYGLQTVAVQTKGLRLIRDPRISASATADYSTDVSMGKLDVSGTVYYSSSYSWHYLNRLQTNAYATLAGQISLTPTGTNLNLSIYGKNLTNKAFVTGAVLDAQADGAVFSEPRQMGVRVNYAF